MLTEQQLDQFIDEFWEDIPNETQEEEPEEDLEEYTLPSDGMIIRADGKERESEPEDLVCPCFDAFSRSSAFIPVGSLFPWKEISDMQPDRDRGCQCSRFL